VKRKKKTQQSFKKAAERHQNQSEVSRGQRVYLLASKRAQPTRHARLQAELRMSNTREQVRFQVRTKLHFFIFFFKVPFSNAGIKIGLSKLEFEASASRITSTYFILNDKSASQKCEENLADRKV